MVHLECILVARATGAKLDSWDPACFMQSFCAKVQFLMYRVILLGEMKLDLFPVWWAVLWLWKFYLWHWTCGKESMLWRDCHFLFPVQNPTDYNLSVNWVHWTGVVILFTMENWPYFVLNTSICIYTGTQIHYCIQVSDLNPIKFSWNFSH